MLLRKSPHFFRYSALHKETFDALAEYVDMISQAKCSITFPCLIAGIDVSNPNATVPRARGTALAQRQRCPFREISTDLKEIPDTFYTLCALVAEQRVSSDGITTPPRTVSPGLTLSDPYRLTIANTASRTASPMDRRV